MTENHSAPNAKEHLESLAKGLQALGLYSRDTPTLTIQEVAARLDITRASARRILLTLAALGYLKQNHRDFLPTPKVLDLGFAYFASLDLPDLVRPVLSKMAEEVGETCSIGVLDGSDIVFLCREEADKPLKLDLKIGSRLPAYAHSMGQALLSQLDGQALDQYLARTALKPLTPHTLTTAAALKRRLKAVRKQGYSVSSDELVEGFAGVAIPLALPRSAAPAALSISLVHGRRSQEDMVAQFLPALREAERQIRGRFVSVDETPA
ncbi:helix-turn-helix domain-containing protein [Parapusillimonas granuli]|uniref:Helix-turn-helix domain-containing protein n=2 Tax=Parapusillimonas granuli TaxID=380911 RepID=A0A853FVF3_9BURK|nr:helix-turn-helix domain-containing protein [Parapusillimonas granuli]